MKTKWIFLACGVILVSLLGGCGGSPASDPGKDVKSEALSVYKDILKASPAIEGEHAELEDASFDYEQNAEKFGKHYDCFAIADINGDGVPELIASTVVNFRWVPISVFTYADGKAVLLQDPVEPTPHGTFEQMSTANGAYTLYVCEGKGLHSVWRGATPDGETAQENQSYVLNGTTLVMSDHTLGEDAVAFSDIAKANTAANADAITQ